MELHALKAPDPQGQQRPLVLEPAVLPLDGATLAVELLPPVGPARDQGVQPGGTDPPAGGLALAGRAAPLGGLPLGVGPGERPGAVVAGGRAVLAGLDGGGLAQRDDRVAVAHLAARV